MKVKCSCPCHRLPGIIHMVACCDADGMVEIPSYLEKKEMGQPYTKLVCDFDIRYRDLNHTSVTYDQRVAIDKKESLKELANRIEEKIEWREEQNEKFGFANHRADLFVFNESEMREILVKLNLLSGECNIHGTATARQYIKDIKSLLNP